MILKPPFLISSRLMVGLRVADATISIEPMHRNEEGRICYRWCVDLRDGTEFSGNDLKSGRGGEPLQRAFESFLAFLGAAAESYPDGDNADLFEPKLTEWASHNSDEISCVQLELEETQGLITS